MEWGLQDRDQVCFVPVLLLGGTAGSPPPENIWCVQETGGERIIEIRGSTAPSSTTYSDRKSRDEARESPLFHKQRTGSNILPEEGP